MAERVYKWEVVRDNNIYLFGSAWGWPSHRWDWRLLLPNNERIVGSRMFAWTARRAVLQRIKLEEKKLAPKTYHGSQRYGREDCN